MEITKEESDINPFRYCGEYYDGEIDKIYLRARYYSPLQGRFMTEDPIKDGLNWYSYCGGNPIILIDPSGLEDAYAPSAGARIYINYYSMQRNNAQQRKEKLTNESNYQSLGVEYDWEAEELSYRCDDDINSANSNIEKIKELDEQGLVTGKILDVPVYNQLNTSPCDGSNNLCWATCSAMFASYQLGDTTDRTLYIAQTVMGSTDVDIYNKPNAWANTGNPRLGFGITDRQCQGLYILEMSQIVDSINNGSPFGVLYESKNLLGKWNGHWVVGVGYASAPGYESLVVSNDPWGGIQRTQTYDSFKKYQDGKTWRWTAR